MVSNLTVLDLIRQVEAALSAADLHYGHGTDNALDESAWLVSAALGLSPQLQEEELQQPVNSEQQEKVRNLLERRIRSRQPLAYLLNEAWFAGYCFYIDERAIVPRSFIAEVILDGLSPWLDLSACTRALDMCTGSACIAAALALEWPNLQVDAVDIDAAALEVAAVNIDRFELQQRVHLFRGDLFEPLPAQQQYELILSNPPYVPASRRESLPAEYGHEPDRALFADDDGLDIVHRILLQAPDYLADKGVLVMEVGESAAAVDQRYRALPLIWLETETGEMSTFLLEREGLLLLRP